MKHECIADTLPWSAGGTGDLDYAEGDGYGASLYGHSASIGYGSGMIAGDPYSRSGTGSNRYLPEVIREDDV
jgi:hypothetical protein